MEYPDRTTGCVTVRQATRKDIEAIADLWVELMSFHASLDDRFALPDHGHLHYARHINTALRDENYRVLIAEENGTIIGYVLGYIAQNPPIFPHPLFGFIADLCVTQRSRRHGAGELLVRTIIDWFRGRGLRDVQLNVAHHNPVSQSFWRKMGCLDYLDHMWMSLGK